MRQLASAQFRASRVESEFENLQVTRCRRRLSVSIAVVLRQLYGGCWWVREVTCPKSQRAGFQLAALDIRAAPECPSGPATRLVAAQLSEDDVGQPPFEASHRFLVALALRSFPQVIRPARGVLPDLGKGHDV